MSRTTTNWVNYDVKLAAFASVSKAARAQAFTTSRRHTHKRTHSMNIVCALLLLRTSRWPEAGWRCFSCVCAGMGRGEGGGGIHQLAADVLVLCTANAGTSFTLSVCGGFGVCCGNVWCRSECNVTHDWVNRTRKCERHRKWENVCAQSKAITSIDVHRPTCAQM